MKKELSNFEKFYKSNIDHKGVEPPVYVQKKLNKILFRKKYYLFSLLIFLLLISIIPFTYIMNVENETAILTHPLNSLSSHSNSISFQSKNTDSNKVFIKNTNLNYTASDITFSIHNTVKNKKNTSKLIDFTTKIDNNQISIFNNQQNKNILQKNENDFIDKYDRFKNKQLNSDQLVELKSQEKINRFKYIIEFNSGIIYNHVNYNSINDDYAALYNNSNKERLSPHIGINMGFIFKNNLNLKTGVSLSNLKYNYNYSVTSQQPIIEQLDSIEVVYVNDTITGTQIPVDTNYYFYQDTIGYSTDHEKHNGTTKATYLTIPFNFGYIKSFNKIGFGVNVGINYNFLIQSSGKYFSDNNIIDFSLVKESVFRKSFFNMSFGADLYYSLNKYTFIKVSYLYSPKIKNQFNDKVDLQRNILMNNLNFGLQFRL